jgi:GNAT superfamily N-acetyltransferase
VSAGPEIQKLHRRHEVERFDCGNSDLNRFLARYALQNQNANASQTYVGVVGEELIGYYTLVYGEVGFEEAPERIRKGLARYPVPVMVLARLAVSTTWQRRGVGKGLLKDAVLRTDQAADIAGLRAFAVHAKDEQAKAHYEQFGFQPSLTDPYHLCVLLKDLRATLGVGR